MSKTDEKATKTVKKASTRPKWDANDPRGKRPSPNESATEYEEGTIMTGNDGKKYIVKVIKGGTHRWAKVKAQED